MTLSELKLIRIYGNFHQDSAFFHQVHAFVINETNSMEDKKEALRHMSDAAMGIPFTEAEIEQSAEEFVSDYLEGC